VLNETVKTTCLPGPLITTECRAMIQAGFLKGWGETSMLALTDDYKNELAIWELIA